MRKEDRMKPTKSIEGGTKSWLSVHLETFVQPYLEFIPEEGYNPLSSTEMAVIKNIWRSIKKRAKIENKTIVLPGRDVFIFEILARRENVPTIFIPECSRQTVNHIKLPIKKEDALVLDTGFMGTIPIGLQVKSFEMISVERRRLKVEETQVFPRLTLARNLALKIESTPKYWESGRLTITNIGERSQIVQPLSKKEEFERAAKFTIVVYKDSSPKWIEGKSVLKKGAKTNVGYL